MITYNIFVTYDMDILNKVSTCNDIFILFLINYLFILKIGFIFSTRNDIYNVFF